MGPSTVFQNRIKIKSAARKLFRMNMRFILIARHINLIDHMINFHKQPVEERYKTRRRSRRSRKNEAPKENKNEKQSLPKINYVSKIPRSCFLSPLKQFSFLRSRVIFIFLIPPTVPFPT